MKKEKNVFDFTKVTVEMSFDEFQEMNISKQLGNSVHRATNDLGIDEKARELYRTGKVQLEGEELILFRQAVLACDLIAPAKKAVLDILSNQ